jgi:hypothetical protein
MVFRRAKAQLGPLPWRPLPCQERTGFPSRVRWPGLVEGRLTEAVLESLATDALPARKHRGRLGSEPAKDGSVPLIDPE